MARQNIEDQFWLDVMAVASARGVNVDLLAGNALRFQRYAQELYKSGRKIARSEFDALGFMQELIPVFAKQLEADPKQPEALEATIEAVGADKHFSWLLEKSEAGSIGGKKSAENRRRKLGSAQPKPRSTPEADLEATPKHSKHFQPSSSTSSSINNTNTVSAVVKPRARKRQELFDPKNIEELKAAIDAETRDFWQNVYPDQEYRQREVLKCWEYYRLNERKRPTTLSGWKRVIGAWFERGWARHAANIPGTKQTFAQQKASNGPPPIRYPSAEQVLAQQQELHAQERPPTPEEIEESKRQLARLIGKAKTIEEAS